MQPQLRRIASAARRRLGGLLWSRVEPGTPPFPALRGMVDAPSVRVLGAGLVDFHGWALAGLAPADAVWVEVEGAPRVEAHTRLSRPDVRANLGDARITEHAGWRCTVDLSEGEPEVRVRVVVRDGLGRSLQIFDRSLLLRADLVSGAVDVPAENDVITGDVVIVEGWAAVGGRPPSRVDVEINGEQCGAARIRIPRPDVERPGFRRLGPLAGFSYRGVRTGGEDETLDIVVVVRGRDGSHERLPVRRARRVVQPAPREQMQRAAVLRERTRAHLAPRASGRAARNGLRRLLVFTHSLRVGGGQLYLSELLRQLMPSLERCVVVSPADGALRGDLEDLGMDVVVTGRGMPVDVEAFEGQIREIAAFVRAHDCDAVLLNTLDTWMPADAAQFAGLPTIWAIHESFELADWVALNFGAHPLRPFMRQRLERALAGAERVVFEAHATREMFAPYVTQRERAVVVPYGVDVDGAERHAKECDRGSLRVQLGVPRDATLLLCVGVVEQRKSQGAVIDAFAEIAILHDDAVLVIVGDHPCAYSEALHRAIAATQLGERVRLVPVTPRLWDWYAIADVLVSASDVESLPRTFLEAMAFGVPVLSTSVFGVPEVVEDGRTGWLFEPRDMRALVAAMHRVLSIEPRERWRVGRAGRAVVQASHRSEGYGKAYGRLLDEIVEDASEARLTGGAIRERATSQFVDLRW